MRKTSKIALWTVVLAVAAGFIYLAASADRLFGCARMVHRVLVPGNFNPSDARMEGGSTDSRLRDYLLDYWSRKPMPDWQKKAKVDVPRIMIACLLSGKRVEEVNRVLAAQVPNATIGSTWYLHRHGDYDFTLMALTPMLYFFGDRPEVLYPATREHLLKVLLNVEGGRWDDKVPRSLGRIGDTENHLLMINGSRYLKNRWLRLHGNKDETFDNHANGLERKLLDYLLEIYQEGVYEFNANPYQGYTLSALLNLDAFGGDSVKLMASRLLDRMNWDYALGSFDFRRFPPFRRRYSRAASTGLDGDYQAAMMKTWISFYLDSPDLKIRRGQHQALWAAIMPYRPPAGVIELTLKKRAPYFVKMGHGPQSCPEIYSVDSLGVLTAGGANQGTRSLIIARPITFITSDTARELTGVFHLEGPGTDFMGWNNTGVYRDFACAAGPVHVPAGYQAVAAVNGWQAFRVGAARYLATYSTDSLGLMALCSATDPGALLDKISRDNPPARMRKGIFVHPDGDEIGFDVRAPRNLWVITEVNHTPTDRQFDGWPMVEIAGSPLDSAQGMH